MKNIGTKNLETERLILRKFVPSDYIKAYENYCTDENVTRYMTWYPHKDLNETKELVNGWFSKYNDNKFYNWVITLKDVDEAINHINKYVWKDIGIIFHGCIHIFTSFHTC